MKYRIFFCNVYSSFRWFFLFWYTCIYPELKGLLTGTSVSAPTCMGCEISACRVKKDLFYDSFSEFLTLDVKGFNRKVYELNFKLIKRRFSFSRLYCPKRVKPTTKCPGLIRVCRFNIICNKINISKDVVRLKSIRWRRGMVYVVKFRDGSIKTLNKEQFGKMSIDDVEIVYPGTLELHVVTELVPQGEEEKRLEDIIAAFTQKYEGVVVDEEGLHDFNEWFQNSKSGSVAVIPEKALVPVKSFKVSKIKNDELAKKSKKTKKSDNDIQPSIFEGTKDEKKSKEVEEIKKIKEAKKRKTGKTSK